MHSVNDFFMLIWQENAKEIYSFEASIYKHLESLYETKKDIFCDYAAIILVVSPQNLDSIGKIPEAKDALTFLSGAIAWSKEGVQYLQKELLYFLHERGDISLNKNLEKRFELLRKEEVIGYDRSRKLISLLALIKNRQAKEKPLHVAKAKEGKSFFETKSNIIHVAVENLLHVLDDDTLQERAQKVPQKLKNQKFSIGVTGVMNAGKSTLLNALLAKEVLGTSVVPETANLTILKYAKDPFAKVNFWSKKEWEQIVKSALHVDSMKPFVNQTQKHFKNRLEEYVTEEGKSLDIKDEELVYYTSAKHSDKLCNLVKSVELFTSLKFLQDGVEIVDTPGLDDPVIQREIITGEYLSDCDVMCHLMNVGQSATQKDMEFITETLLYQNVNRLLVLITRIDTVSKKELDEVIEYTKKSIQKQLEKINKGAALKDVLEKIEFIPVSGHMAFLHKIGKDEEANSLGYTLQKTGFPLFEEYLSALLFGKNSAKVNLIIKSAQKELYQIIQLQKELFKKQKELLSKSTIEIVNELESYEQESQKEQENIQRLQESIQEARSDLESFFLTLKALLEQKIVSLKTLVIRRVIDDVSYSLRKEKKKPTPERIAVIIDTAIKDGFIDVLREYRYEFSKKMEQSIERLQRDFEDFEYDIKILGDAKSFLQKHFESLHFLNNNTLLINKANQTIQKMGKKEIEVLAQKLDTIFEEAFVPIKEKIDEKIDPINKELLAGFVQQCQAPLKQREFTLQKTTKVFHDTKALFEKEDFNSKEQILELSKSIQVLKKVQESLDFKEDEL